MPQYVMNKIVKEIENLGEKKNIFTKKSEEKEENKNKNKRSILNKKEENGNEKNNKINKSEYNKLMQEKENLETEFIKEYSLYIKKVALYYFASFIILGFNWYMMTSFCAIFKNTGIKLILNSVISLLASFIIPLILGLITSVLGVAAIEIENNSLNQLFFKMYKILNILL